VSRAADEAYRVAQANRHRLPNPICRRCGYRTYPRWGPHDCRAGGDPVTDEQLKLIGHWAGYMLSNFDFYRLPPVIQVEALVIALSYALGRYTNGRRGIEKFRRAVPSIERLIQQQGGLDPYTMVQSLGRLHRRSRLKARKVRQS
jgi:hypothetical protein